MELTNSRPVSPEDVASRSSGFQDLCLDIEQLDRTNEKKLLRKCDLHVVPVIAVLYMLAFIDRINIGNARIQGIEKDLGMKGNQYNIALFVFFIPYILFEVPSNLIIRKLSPSTWLSSIMVCWGIVTVCQGVTQSYAGLVPHELQWRFNIFFCASILSGAFSGLLSYALANMEGIGGYHGWRWIFIIEGILTVIFAAASKFLIADWPETARFLSEEERQLLINRLTQGTPEVGSNRSGGKAWRRTFTDWKIYLGIIMYCGIVNNGYATSFFTPTILRQLGWTSIHAQVMSIPIYIVACAAALVTALLSDYFRHRYTFAILGLLIASVGYIILLCQHSVPVSIRYFAIYLITSGGYVTQPVVIVWLMNNLDGHYQRSVGAAMQIGFGNLGGIVASNIFLTNEAPTYPVGFGTSLGLLWLFWGPAVSTSLRHAACAYRAYAFTINVPRSQICCRCVDGSAHWRPSQSAPCSALDHIAGSPSSIIVEVLSRCFSTCLIAAAESPDCSWFYGIDGAVDGNYAQRDRMLARLHAGILCLATAYGMK
ncbi:MFS-type transporter cnsO [Physcia stellaris]|nr:MFS-type transporter cnsO [Physcia stellaris]